MDFYHQEEPITGKIDPSIVADYDYNKGGMGETHNFELSLRADGTVAFKEFHETRTEVYTRVGTGIWRVSGGSVVWVQFADLTKDTKVKNKVAISGLKDEVKTDHGIAFELKHSDLVKAPPSGPAAPKNRWTKRS
eukprot:TRINITY_DN675_c0_g1_i1.p1 TRINITY_DN675_c0_g1~~TRINITY_DN675_c0_g1_i1.p1  ORF type:complete len:135 (-),score=34.71 TRINITY_DN675_c0_g1_i1:56-460(-)